MQPHHPRPTANDDEGTGPLFNPPLWIQRRALVSQELKAAGVGSVLDLGCGEGALLEILLNDPRFTQLAGVDVDVDALNMAMRACAPTEYDKTYLRELPVEFNLWHGSIAEMDPRLSGFDAIASIEVVEHLPAEVLAAFPRVTLGEYRPKIMVVTTPNADFNVNFTDLQHGTPEKPFRHWDHKFEWTRSEFEAWGSSAAAQYGYAVRFTGIGTLASGLGNEHIVGQCSQVAIFTKLPTPARPLSQSFGPVGTVSPPYKHHGNIQYPYFAETGFSNTDIVMELQKLTPVLVWNDWHSRCADLRATGSSENAAWNLPDGTHAMPLEAFWNILRVRQLCKTYDRFVDVLQSSECKPFFSLEEGQKSIRVLFAVPRDEVSGRVPDDPGPDHNYVDSDSEDEEGDKGDGKWAAAQYADFLDAQAKRRSLPITNCTPPLSRRTSRLSLRQPREAWSDGLAGQDWEDEGPAALKHDWGTPVFANGGASEGILFAPSPKADEGARREEGWGPPPANPTGTWKTVLS
ncbi:Small RNA 2'-O-methyltransferase [Geranomyces michiganensis]|nr:Small RNA 2'-O-methyltransferase [Geranomyces michiganensis]